MPEPTVNVHQKAEADAVRELAYRAAAPKKLDEHYHTLVVPDDHHVEYIDTENLQPAPTRKPGTVRVFDWLSFAAFVNRHKVDATTTIYADPFHTKFIGVINDAHGAPSTPLAGEGAMWADHRVVLDLVTTAEWDRWVGADGKMMDQETFAEFIEDGIEEIHKPPAAELLELATTFHAKTSAQFRQATVLASGERKLQFDESIDATAGRLGELPVPSTFDLALRPFEGSESYRVVARLRYRVASGMLSIGYKLVRPTDVLRDAFDGERTKIEAETGILSFLGTPPEGVGR